jgi:hypothetical protein
LLLAGCGGAAKQPAPRLHHADATQLITLTSRIARDAPRDGCAARAEIATLQARATALVNAGRVPVSLRRPLLKGVADLVRDMPACTPAPAPALTPVGTQKPSGKQAKHEKPKKEKHGKKGGGGD